MRFPEEKEDVHYSLISGIIHECNSIGSSHYCCDVLDFNTAIWWRCDDETVTELTGLTDNVLFSFFLLVRPPRSQSLLIMGWCSSILEHRLRIPLDSGPIV